MSKQCVNLVSLERFEVVAFDDLRQNGVVFDESMFRKIYTFLSMSHLLISTSKLCSPRCDIRRGFRAIDCKHFFGRLVLELLFFR